MVAEIAFALLQARGTACQSLHDAAAKIESGNDAPATTSCRMLIATTLSLPMPALSANPVHARLGSLHQRPTASRRI